MEGNSKRESTIGTWLKTGNQLTSKIWRLEEDMDFGNIRFQKCVLSGGYREHIWQNLTIGAFIWWGSRRCIKKLLTLVHRLSRSIFEGLSEVKISNFSCKEIYDQIIWVIT